MDYQLNFQKFNEKRVGECATLVDLLKKNSILEKNSMNEMYSPYRLKYHGERFVDSSEDVFPIVGDVIKDKYQLLQKIGHGSFGIVFKCFDIQDGEYYALKLVEENAKNRTILMNELNILEKLRASGDSGKHNIVQLVDHFSYTGYRCMIFELLCINLYQLLHRHNFNGFSPRLVRKFTICILRSLRLMHKQNVIHCDLKPENILLDRPGYASVKIIDFGSSCYVGQTMYTYVQSRFYRSPEIILGGVYDTSIDIWSLGCIIMELLTGTPLFPGVDEFDQIACMNEVLGIPPEKFLHGMKRRHVYYDNAGTPLYMMKNKSELPIFKINGCLENAPNMKRAEPGTISLQILLENSLGQFDPAMLDFVQSCLQWSPISRIKAEGAFDHPWIRGI